MPAAMTDNIASVPTTRVSVVPGGPVDGEIQPPGSKSLTNRALICAAFASGTSRLSGTLVSEDTEVMIESLAKIGVSIKPIDGGQSLVVDGVGGVVSDDARRISNDAPVEMFIANSGTTIRFLTAALTAFGGRYRLAGIPRMHERPIGDLVDAIEPMIEGQIVATSPGKCPPVEIDSKGWSGESLRVSGGVSSQYLSGLMMAAPIASKSVEIQILGDMVSMPYVRMTADLMAAFGGRTGLQHDADGRLSSVTINGDYQGAEVSIEPDASAASYFWAAAAVAGGSVLVRDLSEDASQGDVGFARVLEQMGCEYTSTGEGIRITNGPQSTPPPNSASSSSPLLCGIDVEMGEISDTVQTLSVVALFADGPTRIRGVAHNRFKETDRIGNLAIELRKLGARIDEHDDGLTVYPLTAERMASDSPVVLETYNDHRMAMSFALLGLRIGGIEILNPACTRKTYPEFWADLEMLTGRAHHWSSEAPHAEPVT
ncbi:3-phosphoshikimate 1-carboxyvinyltransferase [Allorhodopirellula heiligendammensis]|uniref:3-phosphoshikimate 1-carboxyvinyltransferase n=1 Tax=Allorhodopirellula heiligendammensis TaxID=2714739 RepID=A0A5C6BFX2_9BACT|nr:3-phosphoshikimate 1-carboxyvinyltransferase [Allorhodopirellula heiligendammensis]TWU10206.1 3-phosphoshikimate 1-carboxyvinyltransferase [Allorhodopirellula heiligendammensis]